MNRHDSLRAVTRRALWINYRSPGVCCELVIASASAVTVCSTIDVVTIERVAGPVLTAVPSGLESVLLSWTSILNAYAYVIYRATSAEGPFTYLSSVGGATQYTDTPALPGIYYYKVTGVEPNFGETLPSNIPEVEAGANVRVTDNGEIRLTSDDEHRVI